ncbi:MAG: hypothetical protein FRX49_12348 [Trebouxia sp. A1-2]|nr:MAG: hypothetical protein FRX49_12348 [Trebouxia sp. A1-2]
MSRFDLQSSGELGEDSGLLFELYQGLQQGGSSCNPTATKTTTSHRGTPVHYQDTSQLDTAEVDSSKWGKGGEGRRWEQGSTSSRVLAVRHWLLMVCQRGSSTSKGCGVLLQGGPLLQHAQQGSPDDRHLTGRLGQLFFSGVQEGQQHVPLVQQEVVLQGREGVVQTQAARLVISSTDDCVVKQVEAGHASHSPLQLQLKMLPALPEKPEGAGIVPQGPAAGHIRRQRLRILCMHGAAARSKGGHALSYSDSTSTRQTYPCAQPSEGGQWGSLPTISWTAGENDSSGCCLLVDGSSISRDSMRYCPVRYGRCWFQSGRAGQFGTATLGKLPPGGLKRSPTALAAGAEGPRGLRPLAGKAFVSTGKARPPTAL